MDQAEEFCAVVEENGKTRTDDAQAFWMKDMNYRQVFPKALYDGIVVLPAIIDKKLDSPSNAVVYKDEPLPLPNLPLLPDCFFKTLTPIFTIRHPASMIPSLYKTGSREDSFGGDAKGMKWDVYARCKSPYKAYLGHPPALIDSSDLIANTHGTLDVHGGATGLSMSVINDTTRGMPHKLMRAPPEGHPAGGVMFGPNLESKGPNKDSLGGTDTTESTAAMDKRMLTVATGWAFRGL
ncbi:hypothetical protein FISHEDRAFT_75895 [Fistulina hepatica ATCC 64428]|uniref:Sulfotransferase domain-containing protein n=1 Tax=Fistulina hepatica ATCC 64428 TaxID=1128425 RepID=A0A0D7A6P6_9AGAR|nr:hypothetical protein FISHEDRAFT_75895 [Fistulina hepatica ATCC 64428]